jgi:hypothetical protein
MFRIVVSLSCAGFALLIGVSMSAGPANAVVYCKTAGVPKAVRLSPLRLSSRQSLAPLSSARRAVSPKVALCDDCLWHQTDDP